MSCKPFAIAAIALFALVAVLCAADVHALTCDINTTQYTNIIKTMNAWGGMITGAVLALIFAASWKG